MYKPDPRLPPDQQVIPTHAKRMMQEKWEKEGKTGSTFDKDFRLLNDEDLSRFSKRQSQIQPEAPKMTEDEEKATQWPLTGAKPTASNGQSELQSPTHGGYKTIPTISSPQFPPGSRAASRAVSRAENPTSATGKPAQPIQVQEQVEPEKQKGGCGCCIVM
ncbi:hypothetical protein M501DRAFT_943657 [Patellaria atrata CBS 101060]|uniref:Uncharacterized protein n=1 Tax=Patellaria atrata CBS 101060 TaxID=1346257 RepID=A0A9P4S1L7_9PEZI|nr:hypothetical protein M501DRAFT_943657 [Patellaria atrata CBS 101060]